MQVVADLHIDVGDDRGRTTAHLLSERDGLVLDVDDPAVLLRAVPGRGLARDLPVRPPIGLVADTPVRLRSAGRDLGQVQLSSGGRLRLRPTPIGLVVAGRTALSYGSGRAVAWGMLALLTATVLTRLRPRHRWELSTT